ncbi:MAG: hypothetical protein BGN86_03070 [Caulobacterales bacterium 68-7]|nr:hypothetical protein [Caulobacterales bacterium]OJU10510.1 MAG: hypothetical protein BGN86_03070 [Caulobacterales bacterium 68-7]
MAGKSALNHARLLGVLLAAFIGRVAAQLVQAWRPVGWLPPFDAWQSGALPYPVLVASQVAIIVLALWVIRGVATGRMRRSTTLGRVLLAFGAIYFIGMAARLVLGLTVLSHVGWFTAILPAIFHLVLAGFVLTWADYHRRR